MDFPFFYFPSSLALNTDITISHISLLFVLPFCTKTFVAQEFDIATFHISSLFKTLFV